MMILQVTHHDGSQTRFEVPESYKFSKRNYDQVEKYIKEVQGVTDMIAVTICET
jgi:hypothetical protein